MKIENEFLSVEIKTKGAELSSVKSANGREFMWQADPEIWARHAPVLFPIVGKLKDDEYKYDGDTYTLTQHGFARDMEFDVVKWNSSEVWFSLKSDLKTYVGYPFDFDFRVGYKLVGNSIEQTFSIQNTDEEEELPVSFGAHPAFQVDAIEDCVLEFDTDETESSDRVINGLRVGEERACIDGNRIQLSNDIFNQDALIFSKLSSDAVTLKNNQGERIVRVTFPDFPFLGIWSKPKAPYVCIEPWCGIADHMDHNKEILEKEGMLTVSPQETISRTMKMEFFD